MPTNLELETLRLRLNDPDLIQEETPDPNSGASKQIERSPSESAKCPYNADGSLGLPTAPYRFVPLRMGGGGRTHTVSNGSASLMDEVTLDDLMNMTEQIGRAHV